MLTITDGGSLTRALSSSLDLGMKRLLRLRCRQLGGDIKGQARFIIVQRGDRLKALEQELGWSLFTTPEAYRFSEPAYYPGWEWLADHGHCFELVFIFDDSGFAHVVLVENSQGVDPELLKLCVTDQV